MYKLAEARAYCTVILSRLTNGIKALALHSVTKYRHSILCIQMRYSCLLLRRTDFTPRPGSKEHHPPRPGVKRTPSTKTQGQKSIIHKDPGSKERHPPRPGVKGTTLVKTRGQKNIIHIRPGVKRTSSTKTQGQKSIIHKDPWSKEHHPQRLTHMFL